MESSRQPKLKKKLTGEVHQPPSLVGRIVEKGFSLSGDSSKKPSPPLPRPSILPFPVARHRAHGPHWSPAAAERNIRAKTGEGEEEQQDANFDTISSFANPIERREKKDLNFSRWRELVSGNGSPAVQPEQPERKRKVSPVARNDVPNGDVPNGDVPNGSATRDYNYEIAPRAELAGKKDTTNALESDMVGSMSYSMDEDIDVENLVRLKQMSPEEIAEAQAELMEKIDPAKLDMLKKRGIEKMGGKKGPAPDRYKGRQERSSGDMLLPSGPSSSSWKAWSERVEKVRMLRFSLEGNVLEMDSTQEQSSGNNPQLGQYSIENVAERDFLRTEGDPAAVGYTIKEAVALIRSLVPGQRTLALHLLASVFNKALHNLQKKDGGYIAGKTNPGDKLIDWQAVWAFALGPEPEMALSLRIALDDNHDSVVLACGKVIQSVLSCDINESFFNLKEKLPTHDKNICTAPIFRRRPEVDGGFLQGGFWKYNTKSSNIFPPYTEDEDEEGDEKHTIQDDAVVAGQDIAAGLVRMGILPRICYLLEMDPLPALEECLVSILVALARHSPICASAIIRCPRLIQTVANILTRQGTVEVHPSQIKAVLLLKVLAQSDKQVCFDFVKRGVFQAAVWQWYRKAFTLEQWIRSGREQCRLTSAMLVEQLRLWKVCIRYGYCITCFADFFPAMCLWLSPPTFEKLIENNILFEFASITREAYLVMEALAQRLPNLHSIEQLNKQESMEAWSWSHVVPMVDLAINWLSLKNIPYTSSFVDSQNRITDPIQDSSLNCMLWAISSVLHMLSSIFDRIPPCNNNSSHLPWLPQFVPKVGLEIVRNGFLSTSPAEDTPRSLVEGLCRLRHQNESDTSLSSLSFLHGLVRLAFSIDSSVQRAKDADSVGSVREHKPETAAGILEEGIIKWAQNDLLGVLSVFMNLVSFDWLSVQSIEMFGRGGPAPGIGAGWGSSGGGFWSPNILLAQMDAELVLNLLEALHEVLGTDHTFSIEGVKPLMTQRISSVLGVCLIAGPGDRAILEKAFAILLQPSVLKYLSSCAHVLYKSFDWQYKDDDYLFFSKTLNSHFRERWLSIKQKKSPAMPQKCDASLETIHEDLEISESASEYQDQSSLLVEWAHQRLPLPVHWFLSPICSIGNIEGTTKSGLFFLLGLEALSSNSPVSAVPLVWKFHALSVSLHAGVGVLQEERTRNVLEALQGLYGQHLDKSRCGEMEARENGSLEILNFQTQVHESYSTFMENIIEQFGGVSYGDVIYGRQIALYLHRSVEASVRLATWTVLSNAHVHEYLPPLDKCIAEAEGYLEPAEDNEAILEAYTKAWISGGLDRAAVRASVSFTLALRHLSCLIFRPSAPDKLSLRKKVAKSLLRSYSQKLHQQGMLLDLVRYNLPATRELQQIEIERRTEMLKQACDGNSTLLAIVKNLTFVA